MKILVSKCLLGHPCRYDGKDNKCPAVTELLSKHEAVPVCPEQLGGLPTPRPPSEINGDRVVTKTGVDVTAKFALGGQKALQIARESGVCACILKARSPSCGCGRVYDGSFSHTLRDGDGVTASLLKQNGYSVFTEEDVESGTVSF